MPSATRWGPLQYFPMSGEYMKMNRFIAYGLQLPAIRLPPSPFASAMAAQPASIRALVFVLTIRLFGLSHGAPTP